MLASEVVGLALLIAIVADVLFGEPDWLYRRVPHPVVVIGRALAALEKRWLVEGGAGRILRRRGRNATLVVVLGAALAGLLIQWICLALPFGALPLGLLMSTLLAQRSLAEHVMAVAGGLDSSLAQGRLAVGRIVGRDPASLDEAGVARAAVESAAENFADGVVAPLFWAMLLGLPGLLAYKALNTADSMIGHRSARYEDFGRFAARLDDVANWLPARLAGGLIAAASWIMPDASAGRALAAMRRDAGRHRSPNAGWPESAMAGALGFRLAGPRQYGGVRVADAWMGDGRPGLNAEDIRGAVGLFWRACLLAAILVAAAVVAA